MIVRLSNRCIHMFTFNPQDTKINEMHYPPNTSPNLSNHCNIYLAYLPTYLPACDSSYLQIIHSRF